MSAVVASLSFSCYCSLMPPLVLVHLEMAHPVSVAWGRVIATIMVTSRIRVTIIMKSGMQKYIKSGSDFMVFSSGTSRDPTVIYSYNIAFRYLIFSFRDISFGFDIRYLLRYISTNTSCCWSGIFLGLHQKTAYLHIPYLHISFGENRFGQRCSHYIRDCLRIVMLSDISVVFSHFLCA